MNEQDITCQCPQILVIDDEFTNIFALQIVLKGFGLTSDWAMNG